MQISGFFTKAGQEPTSLTLVTLWAPKHDHSQLLGPRKKPNQGGREAATLTGSNVSATSCLWSRCGARGATNPGLVGNPGSNTGTVGSPPAPLPFGRLEGPSSANEGVLAETKTPPSSLIAQRAAHSGQRSLFTGTLLGAKK